MTRRRGIARRLLGRLLRLLLRLVLRVLRGVQARLIPACRETEHTPGAALRGRGGRRGGRWRPQGDDDGSREGGGDDSREGFGALGSRPSEATEHLGVLRFREAVDLAELRELVALLLRDLPVGEHRVEHRRVPAARVSAHAARRGDRRGEAWQ